MTTYNKPFLRWAGGKHSQLDQILPLLPSGSRLIEPFVGAGSVFMNAGFNDVLINDLNPHLTYAYRALISMGQDFIDKAKFLQQWVNCEDNYRELVREFNSGNYSEQSMGIFFSVINRTCFNGLCRYNLKKEFNVPWGQREIPYFPEEEMSAFRNLNQNIKVMNADFKSVFKLVRSGDVVFCDPPYEPLPGKAGFTTYTGSSFTMDHQQTLVECAVEAHQRGAKVVITNSSAPSLIALYKAHGFEIHPLVARRRMAANPKSRHDANDIIAILK